MSEKRWAWQYLLSKFSISTDDNCLIANRQRTMIMSTLVQIVKLTPLIVLVFSNDIKCKGTTNYICSIRGGRSWIVTNTANNVAKRVVWSIRPRQWYHIHDLGLEWAFSICASTTSRQSLSSIVCERIYIILMGIFWILHWVKVLAIETNKNEF